MPVLEVVVGFALGALVGLAAPRLARRARARGDLIGRRYRLLRVLGEGGAGRAHLARDERSGRLVVVKLVHGGDAAREARLARLVRSPHVVRVLDAGPAPGGTFLAMEYAEGGALADRLAPDRPLPVAEARRVAEALLAGLAATHRAGLVHGDVTPANVVFGGDGRAMLADFGAARPDDPDKTRDAAACATVAYAAPEVLRGERPTKRSDVYSAGAVLHRLLAGRVRAAWDEDDALDRAPPDLRAVVRRALARDPDIRYADAAEMLRALREVRVPVAP